MKIKTLKDKDIQKLKEIQIFYEDKKKELDNWIERFPPNKMVKGSRVYNIWVGLMEEFAVLTEKLQEETMKIYSPFNIPEEDLK